MRLRPLKRNVINLASRRASWLAVRQLGKRRMRWQQALAVACALCFHGSMALRYSTLVGPRRAHSLSLLLCYPRIQSWGRACGFKDLRENIFPASWWSVLLGTLDTNRKQNKWLELSPHSPSTCYWTSCKWDGAGMFWCKRWNIKNKHAEGNEQQQVAWHLYLLCVYIGRYTYTSFT